MEGICHIRYYSKLDQEKRVLTSDIKTLSKISPVLHELLLKAPPKAPRSIEIQVLNPLVFPLIISGIEKGNLLSLIPREDTALSLSALDTIKMLKIPIDEYSYIFEILMHCDNIKFLADALNSRGWSADKIIALLTYHPEKEILTSKSLPPFLERELKRISNLRLVIISNPSIISHLHIYRRDLSSYSSNFRLGKSILFTSYGNSLYVFNKDKKSILKYNIVNEKTKKLLHVEKVSFLDYYISRKPDIVLLESPSHDLILISKGTSKVILKANGKLLGFSYITDSAAIVAVTSEELILINEMGEIILRTRVSGVLGFAFSPKTSIMALSFENKIEFRSKQGIILETISFNYTIKKLKFSPNGKFLITVHKNNDICVWSTKTMKIIQTLPYHFKIQAAAISSKGKEMAILRNNGRIDILSLGGVLKPYHFMAEENSIIDMEFTPP